MKLQPLAQLEGPQAVIGAFGPAFNHLRFDFGVFIRAKKRVIDHVAMVAAHVGGCPNRVENSQV